MKERGLTYPSVVVTPELLEAYGGISGTPTAFLVDKAGKVVKKYQGDSADIQEDIEWSIQVLLGLKTGERPKPEKKEAGVLRLANDVRLLTLDGKEIHIPKEPGKVLLVNFWLAVFESARNSLPRFEYTYQQFKDKGLEVLSVHIDSGSVPLVKEVLAQTQVTHPNFLATPEAIDEFQGLFAIPTLFIVDQKGVVRKRYESVSSNIYGEIDATIVDLLNLTPPGHRYVPGHWDVDGNYVEGHFEKVER